MDRHEWLRSQHWLREVGETTRFMERPSDVLFSGRCCFHLTEIASEPPTPTPVEEISSTPGPSQMPQWIPGDSPSRHTDQLQKSTPMPAHILYFHTDGSQDPTELTFEFRLVQEETAQGARLLAIAELDGKPYQLDLTQVEKLACVGMMERERLQDRPPFARLTLPFVSLQFFPDPGFDWKTSVKQLHRCMRKLLGAFGSRATKRGTAARQEISPRPYPATSTTPTSEDRRQPPRGAIFKKRENVEEGKAGRASEEEIEVENRGHERKHRHKVRKIEESSDDEEGRVNNLKMEVDTDKDNISLLEEAKTTYDSSWADLMKHLQRLSDIGEDKGLAQVKKLIQDIAHLIPPHYARLFPSDDQELLQRRERGCVWLSEAAVLHRRCSLLPAQLDQLKQRLTSEKQELENLLVATVGQLFPQRRGSRAVYKTMDPQQITMLEDLQQKMGDICEVEALIEVLCQRLV